MGAGRRSSVAVVVVLAGLLAGCGDDEEGGSPPVSTEMRTQSASPTPTEPAGLPSACDVLAPEDVAAAYGASFGRGSPGGGGHTEQDVAWQSDNCEWEVDDQLEVTFALSGPDDFAAGFTCPEPTPIASTVEPVPDLGTAAWWEQDESPPLEATLRVCTEAFNFDLSVELEDDYQHEGDPRAQTVGLAEVALTALG
jgi:hypothetical protein